MAKYIVLRNLAVGSKRAPQDVGTKNWEWSPTTYQHLTLAPL